MKSRKLILAGIAFMFIMGLSACDDKPEHEKVNLKEIDKKQEKIQEEEISDVFKVKVNETETWIYYLGANGKRYIFPNEGTYQSWYGDQEVTSSKTMEEIAEIEIGGNVTYRPGVKMLKTESVDEIFFVAPGGILRQISPEVAQEIYGENWEDYVEEIENYYFTNYKIGKPINSEDEIPFVPDEWTINDDKNLF